MANELSEEDCTYFDAYVQKWQQRLNLGDWRIERGSERAEAGTMAEVSIETEDRLATYRIGTSFGNSPVNELSLEATALHELLHVFLYPLTYSKKGDKEAIEHGRIHVLEKLLMELR